MQAIHSISSSSSAAYSARRLLQQAVVFARQQTGEETRHLPSSSLALVFSRHYAVIFVVQPWSNQPCRIPRQLRVCCVVGNFPISSEPLLLDGNLDGVNVDNHIQPTARRGYTGQNFFLDFCRARAHESVQPITPPLLCHILKHRFAIAKIPQYPVFPIAKAYKAERRCSHSF